jgi:hypothetical protein
VIEFFKALFFLLAGCWVGIFLVSAAVFGVWFYRLGVIDGDED